MVRSEGGIEVDHNLHEIKKKMHPFFDVFVKIIIESIKNSVD
jgi:hypothetical protein